tara:strand:+ start:15 stop:341 length:327 start_codon:yes stop_codon:yes gene_type:complete
MDNIKKNKRLLSELKDISVSCDEEVCGFIKDNEFHARKNAHPDPKNFFLIAPSDCVWGDDVVLFHSHPRHAGLKGFSDWDLQNQKIFDLSMVLYSVKNDEFYYYINDD